MDRQALAGRVGELLAHPPAVVLVDGAAGLGKSWLAAQVRTASRARVRVLIGCRGLPAEPYVLLREVVRGLVEAGCDPVLGHAVLAAVSRRDRSEYRICLALRELLADAGSALLVLDDLDQADRCSRQVLRCAATRLPPGVGLLVTAPPQARWAPGHRVELAALTPAEVAGLARARHGSAPAHWVAGLHRLTGGIPLLLNEILDRTHPGDQDPAGTLVRTGLPRSVLELATARLHKLSGADRAIVQTAALLREPISVAVPARVCEVDQERAAAALDRAVDAGLLVVRVDGAFEFRPPLLGLAVAATMSLARRRSAHRAIARVLDGVERIHHCRAAGDLLAAARHAERATRTGAPATAVGPLRELLGEAGLPRRVRATLAGRLGRLTVGSWSDQDTVTVLRELVADESLPSGVHGELRLHLGLLLANQAGDADAGRTQMVRAVGELRRRPALAARAMSALALPHLGAAPVAEHLRWLAELDRVGPPHADPGLRTAIEVNRATALLQLGDPRAWNALPTAGPRLELHRGRLNFTDAAITLGHHRSAADFLAAAEVSTAPYLAQVAETNRLRLALVTGDWSGLAERVRAHLDAGPHNPRSAAESRLVLARLALAAGDWAAAEDLLDGPGWCGSAVFAAAATRIRLATAQGQPADLDAALALVRGKGVWVWAAELVDAGVEALLGQAEHGAARELLAEFAAGIDGRDCPLGEAVLCHGQGLLGTGDAVNLLTAAAARFAALPRPYEQARALEALARRLFALGARTQAGQRAAEAARLFSTLGASWDLARCARLHREHFGAPGGGPGRRGYGGALSPREREVARLITTGRTNREIAALLFLSPRTVERHVASLLRKLSVPTRNKITLPT
ncbi:MULTISPECIES: LuxR family transcriptional regulator [unclassified Crossiella]|uniref:LuxR C-terminal-related transcriptional regulator n=1 Tax=unclassified Crossiella TaxID=2620835 RepID=UPI001FFEF014|nr:MULTISPECIES: LuxR family transcriptional regulator [unclassified Crossiella]MCK2243435.1 LuxR C-terminal-related transcriptional regulator [Crossiella sp. S99.2]MCK2257293.1 LuxR C-terminal-related transcriptional regulator [Crossiella sp. S99.1]